ncbi:hypothetical protein [Pseudoxanthomonas mexicana]|uniref:hypothetical protein n=1 Tax=Pseudoxanthomonas mexicana TaxID=128785 RepID=UPI00398B18B8
MATITIKSEPLNRYVTTKNGQKQVHFQNAQLETSEMRVQVEVEIDGPQQAYVNGKSYQWDVEKDVIPGRFGPELARRYSLRDMAEPTKRAAAA